MEINRTTIMEIVNTVNIKPDKDYGQNFLLEPEICQKIVDSLNLNENDKLIEIGPGLGSLSHFLSLSPSKNTLVDIDGRMIDFLNVVYKDSTNIEIVENDIRKTDISCFTKILGNLPYNITTETVIYLLTYAKKAEKMVLMCQSEAFNRFFDLKGENYGPASVLVHLLGDSKRLFVVKPGSFYPAPKCNSTVFEVNINKNIDREEAISIYKLSKQLFLNRRKTILNNLVNYTRNKDLSIAVLKELNIPQTKRPEEISPELFANIYKSLKKSF